MAPCPESLATELPELCRSVTPEERKQIHEDLAEALGDFFLHYLGSGKNLPAIAPPPELTPPAPKVAPVPLPAERSKQRRTKR